jgi:hypothetical protein
MAYGDITPIDNDDQGGQAWTVIRHLASGYLVLANADGGLLSYTMDGTGNLVYVDDLVWTGDQIRGVCETDDGNLFSCNSVGGVSSLSIDENGAFTVLDSDNAGGSAVPVMCVQHPNGKVLVAAGAGGLQAYTINAFGIPGALFRNSTAYNGGGYRDIVVDPESELIFVAADYNGIQTYSIDDAGALTYVGNTVSSGNLYGITIHPQTGYFLTARSAAGIASWSHDGIGGLTFVDQDTQPGSYIDLAVQHTSGIIVTGVFFSMHSYSVDGAGTLTLIDTESVVGVNPLIYPVTNLVVQTEYTSGISSYSLEYNPAAYANVGIDTTDHRHVHALDTVPIW